MCNGYVIGEFVCNEIEILCEKTVNGSQAALEEMARMTFAEFCKYVGIGTAYGWNISDLVIYDKPRALSEFFKACDKTTPTDCSACVDHSRNVCKSLKRPPQSWCYVEEMQV